MSGVRRRKVYANVVANRHRLIRKVEEAADILRPIYEADPKVREWFGHQGYGGETLTPEVIASLKAPI